MVDVWAWSDERRNLGNCLCVCVCVCVCAGGLSVDRCVDRTILLMAKRKVEECQLPVRPVQ